MANKRKVSPATKKRLRHRRSLAFRQDLRAKGIKDPDLYIDSLRAEFESKCPEYYAATTDKKRAEVLEKYRIEDEICLV